VRRSFGCGCLGCAGLFSFIGIGLFLVSAVPNPVALTFAAIAAILPVPTFIFLILQLDRYEREPWHVMTAAFLWGALVATLFSAIVNTLVGAVVESAFGEALGDLVTSGVVAPIVEESSKGFAVLLLFLLVRNEFDNVLDGIVYGSLIGLGFAMTENILYFGRIYAEGGLVGVGVLFYVRVILGGLGHALYTASTGAAIGFIRERSSLLLQIVVPPIGYMIAVGQHAAWNAIGATLVPAMLPDDLNPLVLLFVVMPITSFVLTAPGVVTLLIISILSWRREATIIRTYLADEVADGTVTGDEYAMLPSLGARFREEMSALRRRGVGAFFATREFHQAATELAFRKWHLARGERPKRAQRITPEDMYRHQIAVLRARLAR